MSGSKMLIMLGFLLGVPAFAQCETAPDHFDSIQTVQRNGPAVWK